MDNRIIRKPKAIDTEPTFGEDDCPIVCEECGGMLDLYDAVKHPRSDKSIVICEGCADEIEKQIEREEEIEELKTQISDAEDTIRECKKRLSELSSLL